ncbi:hypothetical protein CC80DRAFT_544221 [Byssothecium circinans]|uniref:Uncharacterized protein n=1 Tax=Byssothecium circinans TaxID=147558 RepID=A0A6A5U6Q2_9PLEO|nr:hypothetical protein CC80DRAFT_544221 [Byssothecium circinans]
MSPAPITQNATAAAAPVSTPSSSPASTTSAAPTPPLQKHMQPPHAQQGPSHPTPPPQSNPPQGFDDIFHHKFMTIIQAFKQRGETDPNQSPLTSNDRKAFIISAYEETDKQYFGDRPLSDQDIKLRALTKVFYRVLAEEPWSEEWIRPHDVERKLSRFEMHKDSVALAREHGIPTVREAIHAARLAELKAKDLPQDKTNLRGPYDEIEVIFIPGTVSSTATAKISRDTTYPVSVASVAHILQTHICRDMTRPYIMAHKFVTCTDTEELTRMRQFACDVVDFAPHLLDNDNCSLLIILLILTRSEICKRFENNGIRIEGSTISHRKAECMKGKLAWRTVDERKPFDNVATELQTRVKNACFPAPRAHRPAPSRKTAGNRKMNVAMPGPHFTHTLPGAAGAPPIGFFAGPQMRRPSGANGVHINITNGNGNGHSHGHVNSNGNINTGINIPAPPRTPFGSGPPLPSPQQLKQAQAQALAQKHKQANTPPQPQPSLNTGRGATADDPMDLD